jgi:hypothetical protein
MTRQVDRVRAEVAQRTRAGDGRIEMPVVRRRVPAPGLEISRTEVHDLAELTGLHELAREANGGYEAIVEAGRVNDACVLGGAPHRVCLARRQRERLLAEDVLARACRRDRRLRVKRVRPAVDEQADSVVCDLLVPVRRRLRPAQSSPGLLERLAVAAADRDEVRLECGAELAHGSERTRVGVAHEAIAEHRDADASHVSSGAATDRQQPADGAQLCRA